MLEHIIKKIVKKMSPIELNFPKKIMGLFVVWEGRKFQIETRCEFFKFIFQKFPRSSGQDQIKVAAASHIELYSPVTR